MIDPEKIERQIATMIADLAPRCAGSGPDSVTARMQSTVIPALVRWKLDEANRGVDHNVMLNVFVQLVSSQLVALIGETIGEPEATDDHYRLVNQVLNAIGEETGAILSGARQMAVYTVPAEAVH